LLEKYQFSFDLHINPYQMPEFARLAKQVRIRHDTDPARMAG
jgi:hypothetical protein